MEEEKVLVIAEDLCRLLHKPFESEEDSSINVQFQVNAWLLNHTFKPRSEVENDPKFKQIIPYVLVRNADRFLLLQRLKKQGETRLHGKHSLGVGGHINQETPIGDFGDIFEASMHRELGEEIKLSGGLHDDWYVERIGLLYDDSNDVGKVHIGIVYCLDTVYDAFEVGEKDQMTAKWATFEEILAVYDNLENWSKLCFDRYVRKCLQGTETASTPALATNASQASAAV